MNEAPKRPRGRPRKIREQQVAPSEMASSPDDEMVSDGRLTSAALKVYIYPSFGEEDKGDGGIRRVVEAQLRYLPAFGIDVVTDPEEADVIAYHATVPSTFIRRFPAKTFVSLCHGLYWSEYEWDNWSLKANADVLEGIRVSDAVVACSEWVANAIRRNTSRKVEVIYHGIDTDEWSGENNLGYVLWNKTRPDPVCDPEPVNRAAELLPEVQFISTFGREAPNVKLTGKLPFDQAKELIRRAGVYLCTARETFGIGTLEAAACGVPIVGFNFGGQAEFIENGINGYLVTPGDYVGLANGIQEVLRNRQSWSEQAKRLAKEFTWERAVEQYARVFKEAHERKTIPAPRTSIVITNYNLGNYLVQALKSVSEQTDDDWECIVVDDDSNSKDTGREWVREFASKDNRFRLIENEENQYLAGARNTGIKAARGRYILPLDADDLFTPNTVKTLADALDADRSIHIAYGRVFFVEEDGTPTDYGRGPGKSSWPFPFTFEQQIQQRNLLPYASMFRKQAWEETGGYRQRCRTAEDADMWTRFASYGYRPKMVTEEDCLIYRNREGSMSRREGAGEWIRWFSWAVLKDITPAGAVTREQLPVPSLDPVIVSVIIPVGPGHEIIVTDAIDSVDTQSFRNWECILVNDTGKPFETPIPSWVRVVETTGKTGAAHARNTGIKASKGRYYLPLDADDYLQPDALQFMYEAQENFEGVVYSDFWQDVGEGGLTIHHCDDYDPKLLIGGKRQFNGETREGMIHTVTALTPKRFWERVGGYDEKLPAWEDWDFQLALGNIGVCSRRVAAPLFFYRKHTGMRREDNYANFEQSKAGILKKWGHLWEGGIDKMPCSSCQRGRTIHTVQTPMLKAQKAPNGQDALLIEYVGEKQGNITYRGSSKTLYVFGGRGDQKYVLAQDAQMFLGRSDFRRVEPVVSQDLEPVLVADGRPTG